MTYPCVACAFAMMASAATAYAAKQVELGVPVFVSLNDGSCAFVVQDMIMTRKQLQDWFEKAPDKTLLIDVVRDETSLDRCVERASRSLKRAGMFRVRVHKGSGDEYGPSPYFQK